MLKKRKGYTPIIWLMPLSLLWLLKIFTAEPGIERWVPIAIFLLNILAIVISIFEGYKNTDKINNEVKS